MLVVVTSAALTCAGEYGQCGGDGWDGQHCCAGIDCEEKDEYYSQCIPRPKATPATIAERAVVTSAGDASAAGIWSGSLERGAAALEGMPFSLDVSIGILSVSHSAQPTVQVIRNPGGGTSKCCKQHRVAAGARVHGNAVQVRLEPRTPAQIDGWSSRNGARVYLASTPSRSGAPLAKRLPDVEYVGWDLIGKRLEFTIDLSAASCGCVRMRSRLDLTPT